MADSKSSSPAGLKLALAGSVLLVVAGVAAFWYASRQAQQRPVQTDANAVTVTIEDRVCKPNDITVPAGKTTFTIVNKSDRALEWEILDGVMVVEERENIAPGFSQKMTVKLRPGDYDITCGLLSNPHGKLHVTASADSEAEAARPPATAFIGPLAEYRVYLIKTSSSLQKATETMVDAISAGQLDEARRLYVPAHQMYKRIEAMADMFADLDQRINARAAYFDKREADPAFMGFHRIEHGLFAPGQGDLATLAPVTKQLMADLGQLRERLRSLDIPPERLASSAARLLRRTADNLLAVGEGAYGHAELADVQGTLDGTRKLVGLLSPLLQKAAPELDKQVAEGFEACSAVLSPYREGEGFKRVKPDANQWKTLAEPIGALAEQLDQVNAALSLE
ncbi:MAG: iron uptake system protein EfeO [Lautropia sp.]|nr:iron uptake system protein EfeO [Lautropia sp.]